jgi:EAL domain-containing protein (putative c-di-GMP-specific phosphodiesterase class I)
VLALQIRSLEQEIRGWHFTELVPFENAQQALSLLEDDVGAVGVIICDLQMPAMDGLEFMRHLAGMGYKGGLILISGVDQRILITAENLARAHDLIVLGVLQKPVQLELLKVLFERNLVGDGVRQKRVVSAYGPDELERAIANGELVNFYQPQVRISTGDFVGVEALVRWRHPKDGLVFPDQFIATAEEHGLIDELTNVVLLAASAHARLLRNQGWNLNVSVNVSMNNLSSLKFPEFVAQIVDDLEVPRKSIILEITESRLMQNPLPVMEVLARLRLKGFGLSIDDFGTGHSSLAQLRDIPFDELKIDQTFVHGAGRDASRHAILTASLRMARELGIKVVAEGAEDMDDWTYLKDIGCDIAQGYFIAPPMPAEGIEEWYSEWEGRRDSQML